MDEGRNIRCPTKRCSKAYRVAGLLFQPMDATPSGRQETVSRLEQVRMQRFAGAEGASALAGQKR